MTVERRAMQLDVALLCALALGVRVVHLGFPPDIDEVNDLLAARSLIEHGAPLLDAGHPYTRARLFTSLVAGMIRLFGDSLVVARIPSVIAGVALVAAVYLWVRAVAGRWAGGIAALLLALYPDAIYQSQLVRFYELHALLFFLGAIAVYRLTTAEPPGRSRLVLTAAGAAVALAVALHLQILTLVGVAGLGLWAAATVGPRLGRRLMAHPRRGWIAAIIVVAAAAAVWAAIRSGVVASSIQLFRYSDAWATENRNNVRFYHWALLQDYATFWTLFPVLVLVACARRPRAAAFCATIFAVAFVTHSLAAWKHVRYIQWAMPFFFAIVGMSIAEVIPALRRRIEEVHGALPGPLAAPRWGTIVTAGAAGFIVLFLLAGNEAFQRALRMIAPWGDAPAYSNKSDWSAAAARLRTLSDSSAVLVSSSDLKALYYVGRLDVILYRDHLYSDEGWVPEFGDYAKLGRPVISTAASVRRVVSCYPTGMVVVENGAWRAPWGVPGATADYLEAELAPVPTPAPWRLKVFRWRTTPASVGTPCALPAAGLPAAATPASPR